VLAESLVPVRVAGSGSILVLLDLYRGFLVAVGCWALVEAEVQALAVASSAVYRSCWVAAGDVVVLEAVVAAGAVVTEEAASIGHAVVGAVVCSARAALVASEEAAAAHWKYLEMLTALACCVESAAILQVVEGRVVEPVGRAH
jgi:hypothetical protein